MRSSIWLGLLLLAACATEPVDDGDDRYEADPGDFDAKADGISSTSPEVLALIDGAHDRLYAQLPTIADKTLVARLTAAAKRGVDVHIYIAVPHAAKPATVLATEQLEAAGVDTTVERTSRLAGFLAIADDKLLIKSGATLETVTGAQATAQATKFEGVIAEDVSAALPAVAANGTTLLVFPEAGVGSIVKLLGTAQASIDLEIYQVQSPAVIAALGAAQQRGVTVRVMLEPRTVGGVNYPAVKAQLALAGITVKETPPAFNTHHNVDHAKFMVIDGRELVFGSGNLVRSGLGGNPAREFDNRDFWVRDRRTAAVAEAKQLFEADWARRATTSTTFANLVLTPDNADARIAALIDGAHERIYLYNQSLIDDALVGKLVAAKQRGVDVRVLLGNQPGFGSKPAPNQAALDDLEAGGVTAGYFTTHYLHGKVVVADAKVFIGSQNFTNGGLRNNRELGEILTTAPIVSALATLFASDQAHPTP